MVDYAGINLVPAVDTWEEWHQAIADVSDQGLMDAMVDMATLDRELRQAYTFFKQKAKPTIGSLLAHYLLTRWMTLNQLAMLSIRNLPQQRMSRRRWESLLAHYTSESRLVLVAHYQLTIGAGSCEARVACETESTIGEAIWIRNK